MLYSILSFLKINIGVLIKKSNKKVINGYRKTHHFLKIEDRSKQEQKLLEELTPILADYAEKQSISFILPKQNIVIGKSELDLTNNIIIILNKKIKTIKLK